MIAAFTSRSREALSRWCAGRFVPEPCHGWEWFFMRLFMALLVISSLQEFKLFDFDRQSEPRGLAHWFDLTFLSRPGPIDLSLWIQRINLPFGGMFRLHGPGWFDTTTLVSLVLGTLYVWGRGLRFTLPLLSLVHILPWTLNNSQGYTHHGSQLISLVLIVQTIVVWWPRSPADLPLRSYLVYYSRGMVAFSYVACAFTKLIKTKGLWLLKSNYICIELIKTHRLDYYGRLSPELAGDPPSATWLLQHPMITRLAFDSGFFVELLAFVALRDRKWALIAGIVIISFHRSVWWLMRLEFASHEWLTLIYLVNLPFWCWCLCQRKNKPLST